MDFIDEEGNFTESFRESLPERLGDAYYNDPETKQKPTKEFDNIGNVFDMAKMVVAGSRKISAHGEQLKNATEGYVKIPGEGATPEEIVAYRQAQGVPETSDGYELNVPKEGGYDKVADMVKAAAHEVGIPPSKLAPVWDKVLGVLTEQTNALEKQGNDLLAADVQTLKDTKKEGYDAFIADTDKVAAHFDVKADTQAGIQENLVGSEFMKLMDSMGIKNVPVVREFLGRIAPLVLEGKAHVGGAAVSGEGEGGFSYNYDENGKPI